MDSSILIPTIAALAGTLIGGLTSFLSSFYLKKAEWKKEARLLELKKREDLYSEYLIESGRLLVSFIEQPMKSTSEFAKISALLGKIRMSASDPVIEAAQKLFKEILTSQKSENKGNLDGDEAKYESNHQVFSQACREELKAFTDNNY